MQTRLSRDSYLKTQDTIFLFQDRMVYLSGQEDAEPLKNALRIRNFPGLNDELPMPPIEVLKILNEFTRDCGLWVQDVREQAEETARYAHCNINHDLHFTGNQFNRIYWDDDDDQKDIWDDIRQEEEDAQQVFDNLSVPERCFVIRSGFQLFMMEDALEQNDEFYYHLAKEIGETLPRRRRYDWSDHKIAMSRKYERRQAELKAEMTRK